MKPVYSLLTVAFILTLIGCGASERSVIDASVKGSTAEDHDHDHDAHDHEGHDHGENHHPESFGEAVEYIEETGGKVTDAFASGKPDDAHHELHEIGQVIELLPGLAEKSGLPSEKQETVREATESLMEAYGKLDGTLHGGDPVEVNDISKQISTQLEKLQSML